MKRSFKTLETFKHSINKLNSLLHPKKIHHIYKIEEINERANQVKISCRGRGAILISSIDSVIYDDYIIQKMPPHHACWLGYYYGKKWRRDSNKNHKHYTCKHNSQSPTTRYRILYQNRAGLISYIDKKTERHFFALPSELAESKKISYFDAPQACYIGFLSGLEVATKTSAQTIHTQSHLRVVK